MNFGRWDMSLIIVMSFAIMTMTFLFPALGLTGQEAGANDIPDFNSTADQYEFRDEFPKDPGAPSKGVMHWDNKTPESEPSQAIFLDGGPQDGVEIAVVNDGNKSDPAMEVFIQNWTDGAGVSEDSVVLDDVGDAGEVSYGDWVVIVEWERQRDVNTTDFTAQVRFTVSQQPSDVTWYGRIPVVGDILDTGSELAAIVGWIGSILYWVMGTAVSIIWQSFATVLDILTFAFGIAHWMTTAYTNVVDGASGWAAVFVTLPGIILSLELAKVAFIGIDLIWIG